MRRLFIVGAKLIGLVCLWWTISTSFQMIQYGGFFILQYMHGTRAIFTFSIALYCAGLLAYIILMLWFSKILIFRTEWLAMKVGLDKDGELPGWPEEKKLLRLGILLLGFFILGRAIPDIVRFLLTLLSHFSAARQVGSGSATFLLLQYIIPISGNLLSVVIGFVLVFMPNRIIRMVEKIQGKIGG